MAAASRAGRTFLRCVQIELRRQGYAVPLDGLWSQRTREALWRATTPEGELPEVGANVRWVWSSLAVVHDRVAECTGSEEAYGAGSQALVELIKNVESHGRLEGDPTPWPWGWFIAGIAVTTIIGVTGLLAIHGRRRG